LPDGIKKFSVVVQEPIYFRFIQKTKFYELSSQDVFAVLLTKFNNGDFDDLFGIPEEEDPL
jgi:hypothetical protein